MMNRPKTRVAFFAENLKRDYDGAVRTMYQLIDRIPHNGFDFLFVSSDGPNEDLGHRQAQLPSVSLPVNGDYKMAIPFFMKHRIYQELDDFKPNVIHIATPSPMGHTALRYAQEHNIPVISIYHTHYLSYIDYYLADWPKLISPARNLLISSMRSFYNQCSVIYTPTSEMEEELGRVGIYKNLMVRWKRGLDTKLFNPNKRDQEHINNITGNSKPNILYASRLVWEKNLELLIDFYSLLEQRGFQYNLIIAGQGYAEKELKSVMPHALFLGYQSHESLSRLYASSDVFLFPSISETYGNVVAEAMASGLPCVIADGGGTREFIDHAINGYLCSASDAPMYLSTVDKLLNNPSIYKRISAQATQDVQGLNWGLLADRYFNDLIDLSHHRYSLTALEVLLCRVRAYFYMETFICSYDRREYSIV